MLLAQAAAGPSWLLAAASLLLRFAIAAVLVAWLARRSLGRPRREELAQAAGLGLFTAGAMLLQIDALGHADAGTVAFLSQGYVVWIPLLLAWRHRRWPSATTLGCSLLVLLGLGVIAGVDLRELRLGRGETESLLGSLLFTAQILWVERPCYAGNRVGLVAVGAFALTALAFVPVLALGAGDGLGLLALYADWNQLLLVLILGAICTGLSMLLMFRWQPLVGASAAGMIYATEPLWAAFFALVLPGLLARGLDVPYAAEPLTTALLVGGSLVVAANLALQLRPQPLPVPAGPTGLPLEPSPEAAP